MIGTRFETGMDCNRISCYKSVLKRIKKENMTRVTCKISKSVCKINLEMNKQFLDDIVHEDKCS